MRAFQFGRFRIDTADRLLLRDGQVVPLPPKAIDTLLLLLASGGRVLAKDELMKAVWPDVIVDDGSLTRNISMLRKALGDEPDESRYIETIPKRGYRWVASISEPAEPGEAPVSRRFYRRPIAWGAGGLALLLAGLLGVYLWPARTTTRSVVVFPLDNLARGPEQDYLTAGMTESLLVSLGKIAAIKVIAHPGPKRGEPALRPAEIARALKAEFALRGSVQQDGDRVRISVQLIESRTGQQLWADQYDGNVRDVLELQGNVSRQIAQAVQVRLTSRDEARLAASRQVVPAAYGEYLKGRYYWNRRTPQDFRKALEHYRQAIAEDPTWAPPHAGLADAFLLLGSTSYDALPPREAMPRAQAAAATALKLDDSSAEAHTSMGYFLLAYAWDLPAAEKEFRRALELNPGYPTAHHWYGHHLLAAGRMDEALAEMRKAQERDPLSLVINTGVAWSLYLGRRYDESIEQGRKTLELESGFVLARCMLAMAYERKSMYAEAIAEFERALAVAPQNPFSLTGIARVHAVSGSRDEALRILRQLAELARSRYVPSIYFGAIHFALGDLDQAFAWIEKACEERSHYLVYLNVDPTVDGVRQDPRFLALLRRVGPNK